MFSRLVTAIASVACAGTGIWCEAPNVPAIQAAYDAESGAASSLHDKDLRILEARCEQRSDGGYLCEVTFASKRDPAERLYFDVIEVAESSSGWALKTGLCKR